MHASSSGSDVHRGSGRPRGSLRWRGALTALLLAVVPVLLTAAPAQAVVPAITSVAPVVGVPGTSVRITGSGFATTAAGNTVTFGSVRATVTAASATALTVVAPSPRVSSKIRVTTPGGRSATRDFFMPPAPYTPAQVASRVRSDIGGASDFISNPAPDRISLAIFDAVAGQRFVVDATSLRIGDAQLRLYSPTGALLKRAGDLAVGTAFLDTTVAPVTGAYSVAIDGRTAGSGNLFVRSVPPDSTGTITRGVAQTVSTTAAGQVALRSFSGTAGQRVALQYSQLNLADDGRQLARLLFVHPNGTKLGTEAGLGVFNAGEGLVDTVTLPVTGTYQVKFDPLFRAVGSVRLLLHAVPPDLTGIAVVGTPFTVTTAVGQNASRTFSATAGQRYAFHATSHNYRGVFVRILRPDGLEVDARSFAPITGFIGPFTAPTTGTYRIVVDPLSAGTGTMTAVLRTVPPDSTGTLTVGTAQTVTTTAPGQNAVRTFTATAGQRFALTASDATFHASVHVTEAQLETEVTDVFTVAPGNEPFWTDAFGVLSAGTFRVRIDGSEGEVGSVRLLLRSVPADSSGTLTPGVTSQIVTTVPGQNARRTFTAQAGQRVGIQFTHSTLGGRLELFSPSGEQLLDRDASLSFQDEPQGLGGEPVLPETGTYELRLNPLDQGIGRVDALLYVAPPDSTGTIAVGGPAQTVTLAAGQTAVRTFSGTAGQRLVVRVTGNTFPGETVVSVENDSGSAGLFLGGPTGELPVELWASGAQRLTIRPSFAATGSVTVQVLPAP